MNNTENIIAGTVFTLLSALSFAIMSLFVKLIGHDLPVSVIIFARFFLSLVFLLPWLLRDKTFTFKIKLEKPIMFFLRSLMPLLALACTFYAIKFIPLIDALLLNNTAPLFVPLAALAISGVKTPRHALLGIALGFIGVIIILNPGHELFQLPSIIALAAGLFAAIAIVLIRVLSKTYSTNELLFYYFFLASIFSGIAAAINWHTPASWQIWLLLLGVGIFGTLYQLFATLAYTRAPVRLMSPLMFFSTIFGGIFDWLFWHNVPSNTTIAGIVLVIAGTLITIYFGHKAINHHTIKEH